MREGSQQYEDQLKRIALIRKLRRDMENVEELGEEDRDRS